MRLLSLLFFLMLGCGVDGSGSGEFIDEEGRSVGATRLRGDASPGGASPGSASFGGAGGDAGRAAFGGALDASAGDAVGASVPLARVAACPDVFEPASNGARIVACADVPVAGLRAGNGSLPAGASVPESKCPAKRIGSGATAAPNGRPTDNPDDCLSDGLIAGGERVTCPAPGGDRVRDLTIASQALGLEAAVRIVLPAANAAPPPDGWPVLYLLTGHSSTYQAWSCSTNAQAYVANTGVILVMPEATFNYEKNDKYYPDKLSFGLPIPTNGLPGWYSDWLSPTITYADGRSFTMNVQQFHLAELSELLAKNYQANPDKMAVAGISMGGFGALHYAAQAEHPFVAAAAFSSFADTEFGVPADIPVFGTLSAPVVIRASVQVVLAEERAATSTGDELWGPESSPSWRAESPVRQAQSSRLASIPLYLSAGQGNSAPDIDVVARQLDGSLNLEEALAYYTTGNLFDALDRSDPDFKAEFFPKGQHDWVIADIALCRALKSTLLPALGELIPSNLVCPTVLEVRP